MPARSSRPSCLAAVAALASLLLVGCAAPQAFLPTPRESAVVTGIASGRASVAGEKSYVLRTASGRVYMVSQVLGKPVKEGDFIEIELPSSGAARIRER